MNPGDSVFVEVKEGGREGQGEPFGGGLKREGRRDKSFRFFFMDRRPVGKGMVERRGTRGSQTTRN